MDRSALAVLTWINARRAWLDRPELDDLEPADEDHADPVTASLGGQWVLGNLQTHDASRVYQWDKPTCVETFMKRWHAGAYPQYQRKES